jgi:hypothetical protein
MCGMWQAHSDIMLEPNVDGFAYDAFERAPELIRSGEEAARPAVAQIKAWLEQQQAPATEMKPAMAPAAAQLGMKPNIAHNA